MLNVNEITIEEGQIMIDRFKNSAVCVNQTRGIKLENSVFASLMCLPNSAGICFYFGLNINNELALVLIAYDNQNNEIASLIMDRGQNIPPRPNGSPFIL